MAEEGIKFQVRKIEESDKIDPSEATVKATIVPQSDVEGQSWFVYCPYCGGALRVGYRSCNWICPNCMGRFCAY